MSLVVNPSKDWPHKQESIVTNRLILRALKSDDASRVQLLAGDLAVAETTLNVPHPYPDGAAEAWIAGHAKSFCEKKNAVFGIVLKAEDMLVGAISLGVSIQFQRAELGYWIGKSFWNKGYATEAGRAILSFAFERLHLHKIESCHLERNPASGRVLQKLGFSQEGLRRDHVVKWDHFENVVDYGLLELSAA